MAALWTLTSMRCSPRSHRLGADRRITNYAGGNTSAKVTLADPVTGDATPVLAVKGSGGDLGTLTADGLALLDLDRLRALERLSAAGVHEDDLVAYYDVVPVRHRWRGAVDRHAAARVPRRRPRRPPPSRRGDRARRPPPTASASSSECFGDDVGWLDWRRPGFELGLRAARLRAGTPRHAVSCSVATASSAGARSSDECEATTLELVARAEAFLAEHGRDEPLGAVVPSSRRSPTTTTASRGHAARCRSSRGSPSRTRPLVGHFNDAPVVLDFLSREPAPRLAAARHLVP